MNAAKAGRTLEDFKPDFKADLHPRTIGGCGPIRGLSQAIFCPKILYCVVSLRLFICSRSRQSVAELRQTPDRAASDVIPAIANESEQASLI